MIEFFSTLNLALVWIVLGAVCIIPLITRNKFIPGLIAVIVVSSIYGTFLINDSLMGRPKEMLPSKEFIFKDYTVTVKEGKKIITVWIVDDIDDRLIRFPHSDKRQKKLKKAKGQAKKGIIQRGKFNVDKKEDEDDFLVFRDVNISEIFPKD